MGGIVVGVDGSEQSRLALEWALREAAVRKAPLTAITVRPVPVHSVAELYWPVPELVEGAGEVEEAAAAGLRDLVDKVAGEVGVPVPSVTVTAVTGDPAGELLRASQDADLLVVGSRGNGGFQRLLLGSVSSKAVHHATCPVVVIPGRSRGAELPGQPMRPVT